MKYYLNEYRAISYIAENMDFIQESLFNNSKKVIQRNSNIIYYDCTNYFFEIDNEDDIRKYGICRVCFRELAHKGEIPGVKKASW